MFKCLTIKNWRHNSVKAMYLTAFSFIFCFILLLNAMLNQLVVSSESSDVHAKEYSIPQKKFQEPMEPDMQNSRNSYMESDEAANEDQKKVNGHQEKLDHCSRKEDNSRALPGGKMPGSSVKSSPVDKQVEGLVVDGIYWSEKAEALVPKGMSKDEVINWIKTIRNGKVKSLEPPSWDRCGGQKNGFVVMKNGIELCARYRHPNDKFILGELLSFYLSLLLKMDNVPAVLLSKVNRASSQWEGTDPSQLEWEENQYVALIQWIDHLEHYTDSYVEIPSILFEMYKTGNSLDCHILNKQNLQPKEISNIIQWGSMIIFDYLTGNYDRVASMQDGAVEQNRQSVIQEFIRNLRKSKETGKYWLIDNEVGVYDGYHLMYMTFDHGDRFVRFHKEMLQTLCIFERPLVEALKDLHNSDEPHKFLEEFTRKYEPLFDEVPTDETQSVFYSMFSKRISNVIEWIHHCESRVKR